MALTLQNNNNETLFEKIARLANEWSQKAVVSDNVPSSSSSTDNNNTTSSSSSSSSSSPPPKLGLVVGATDPQALSAARKAAGPDVWILAPGVGAQGGDLASACKAGLNDAGTGMLIPVSRSVSGAADPGAEAQRLKDEINAARSAVLEARGVKKRKQIDNTNEDHGGGGGGGGVALYQKEFLEFSLQEGVLKFGSFVLKSGRTSPYFFNAGLFSSGSALHKLGKSYAAAIMASEL